MFQHDFRRLVLARDLLRDAVRCGQSPACFPASDPPEAVQRGDTHDLAAASED